MESTLPTKVVLDTADESLPIVLSRSVEMGVIIIVRSDVATMKAEVAVHDFTRLLVVERDIEDAGAS
jgi:hypothetical protein